MNREKYWNYICWGITAFCVVAASIALIFLLANWGQVKGTFRFLAEILAPVIYGAVLAYLLTPIYNRFGRYTEKAGQKLWKKEQLAKSAGRLVGTIVSLILLIFIVSGLSSMLLPELIKSIRNVVDGLPVNIANLEKWLEEVLANNEQLESWVMENYTEGVNMLRNWITNDVMPNMDKIVYNVSNGVFSALTALKNILIGLIVMVYLLNIKDTFCTLAKKIVYGVFSVPIANKVVEEVRFIHQVFSGFIIGKLLDSLIIGILCLISLNLMNMPYPLLVSVIIGVTNIIPFFGPFIGAIPSGFLILLVDPMKCLYFLIFIFLLQQFDGNILGPKILGDSTGLSSFWVLFSILLFGGLFGFVGMIIGVPTFAVFYRLFSEVICVLLKKKQLSTETESYRNLDYIDPEKKTYVK